MTLSTLSAHVTEFFYIWGSVKFFQIGRPVQALLRNLILKLPGGCRFRRKIFLGGDCGRDLRSPARVSLSVRSLRILE